MSTRSKALVLGAKPPFEGPRISLQGAELWEPRIQTVPSGESGIVTIMVEDVDGERALSPGELIRGQRAFVVTGYSELVEMVTVHIDAVE
jgi:hypothetical protein